MYLKRHAASQKWKFPRKHGVFITRPQTTGHSMSECLALSFVLTEMLHLTDNTREAQFVIRNEHILINGKRERSPHRALGLLDVLSIPKLERSFVMGLSSNNHLELHEEIDNQLAERQTHPVIRKTLLDSKRIQLTLLDGRTLLVPADTKIRVGDSIIRNLITGEIIKHLPRAAGAIVQRVSPRNSWTLHRIERIDHQLKMVYFDDGERTTLKNIIVTEEQLDE